MYKYYNSIMECTVITNEKTDESYMEYIGEIGNLASEVYNAMKDNESNIINIFNHKKKSCLK